MSESSKTATIDGIDLSTIDLDAYRKHLGVVLQDDFLYEGTILKNLFFPHSYASGKCLF